MKRFLQGVAVLLFVYSLTAELSPLGYMTGLLASLALFLLTTDAVWEKPNV